MTQSFKKNLTVFSQLTPAQPTEVYETYWRFAVERQAIFMSRAAGEPWPWTDDPILREFKFTNAYRASDRVSQYLIRNVIYRGSREPDEMFFRIILFKLFNRIDTWELLTERLGEVRWADYDFTRYSEILSKAMDAGKRIYSAAYIMPSARSFGYQRKHQNHLRLLELLMEDSVAHRLQALNSMRQGFELLCSYPSIGNFLAYQMITDINYSPLTEFSEMEFVIPGPGARGGIQKCFENLGGLSESDIIRFVTDRQEDACSTLGLSFLSLWGRPLQLIDCQNLFCEVDKYARVAHPNIQGQKGRKRIKQKFRVGKQLPEFWYPPKWGLNEKVENWRNKRV